MTNRGRPREAADAAAAARRLGEALRLLQQGSGRTLRSLERQVLISDSSLSRYFRGSTVPPWATVRDLCRALDADPTEYRALWEAADRGTCVAPRTATTDLQVPASPAPVDAAPVDAACDDASGGRPASPVRRWARAVVARLGRPWVCLTAGVVVGVLVGVALTPLMWRPAPVSGPGSPGAAASLSTHKEGHGDGAALTDRVRIFVSRATGACLDDSLDFGLRSYACNGMSYQRWTEHPFPDGTRRLRNHATGRCLHGDGAGLRTRSCSTSTAQKWLLTAWYDESVEVRSKAAGSCLDDDTAAGLRFLPCDRTKRQKWG